ncbi:MAG: hypothetical protein KF746_21540 [Chitinophagaceae bacterium]|nr:hypothetical protein [Chitinophagaceae bacterium]
MKITLTITILLTSIGLHAQDSLSGGVVTLPPGYISAVDKKINGLDHRLTRQSEKYVRNFARLEEKLLQKISKTDSSAAASLPKPGYKQLNKKLTTANGKAGKLLSGQYLPGVDSLATSLSFLKEAGNLVSKTKDIQQQLGKSLENLNILQGKLHEAGNIQAYVQQRQQQLRQLLSNYSNLPKDVSKYLGKYQREAFYYSQQLQEYRQVLNEPDKLIAKTLAVLQNVPAFSSFWQKHSILAQLFPTPDNYGTPQALAGLQTRAGVQQVLQQQLALPATNGASANPAQYLQQQIQQAQGELSQLKDKLNQLGINGSGGSDMIVPEHFTPNPEKTKSFLKRIQLGSNFSTQRSGQYFPTRVDIAVTAAYRLSEKVQAGIGLSSKLGLGQNWKNIRVTGESLGARVFAEWKAPDLFRHGGQVKTNNRLMSSLWLYAGAELNHHRTIESLAEFKNYTNWSKNALAGLSKKYSMRSPLKKGKKMQGTFSFLYDFLHRRNIPATPAFVWRVGYEF